jgi:hypothetical protein
MRASFCGSRMGYDLLVPKEPHPHPMLLLALLLVVLIAVWGYFYCHFSD